MTRRAGGRPSGASNPGRTTWVDRKGEERPITLDDIVIITPYNAQVFEIQQCLPGARLGTVDKFQGQEAQDCREPPSSATVKLSNGLSARSKA